MFNRLGQFAARYRYAIVLAWVLAAVLSVAVAPPLGSVLTSDLSRFLPRNAPFEVAREVVARTFPDDNAATTLVVVFDAGAAGILDRDAPDFAAQTDTAAGQFIRSFVAWLSGPERPANVLRATGPTASPEVAAMTVGQDNAVAIVSVALESVDGAEQTLAALDAWLDANNPGGIQTYQTGLFAISRAISDAVMETADRSIWVTVVLVIVLLLAIYRSPISPLVPLAAVTLVYLIVSGLVAFVAASGTVISTYANVMLVVVLYGAGTDYCLFLISRFREEMADTPDALASTARTVGRVGETITSSAGTVLVGFVSLVFAEMGLFKTSGPALGLGVFVMLLAGLTFVPALLAILGDRAFWPGRATHRSIGQFYGRVSALVSARPVLTVAVIGIVMAPLAIYGVTVPSGYDLIADLPDTAGPVAGFRRIEASLGAGNMSPLTVVVTERDPATLAADLVALSDELRALPGVADVRSLNDPLGAAGSLGDVLRVDGQLRLIASMLGSSLEAGAAQLPQLLQGVTALNGYLGTLAERFPAAADDPNLTTLRELFANPLQLVARRDALAPAFDGLIARFATMDDAYLMPDALAPLLAAAPSGGDSPAAMFDELVGTYLADSGTAYLLTVILEDSPDTFRAMDTVEAIRVVLARYEGDGQAVVSGQSAVTADIRSTIERDMLRAFSFVILGIFIVLLVMLRSLVAPVYLIATVVLSFAFTLGVTDLLFRALTGVQGLTWYMPFFTFVFLVALGVDYSIFLVGRIKEEIPQHGLREGVHRAVAATGAIITSAGIILAGTFASVTTGTILGLVELGFAVALGVLVDTFVVRTMLVPALTVLLGRWAWWPGGVPGERRGRAAPSATRPRVAG